MSKSNPLEVLFWSIAFPGFGQFLNGKFLKGFVLLNLEFVINTQSNLNTIIILSFRGNIQRAIEQTNYQWLMFYPCVYLFSIWDAYRDSGGGRESYSFIPFVFSAYFGTIEVTYSTDIKIFGALLGPVWLSIFFLLLGVGVGVVLRRCLLISFHK